MSQTVVVSSKTVEAILNRLDNLTREVREIKAKLGKMPSYGSAEWWDWSDAQALKSIREGEGTVIRDKKELADFFKNL